MPGGPPNGSVVYSTAAEFAKADFLRIVEGDEKYITPGLYAVAAIYDAEAVAVIQTFISFLIIYVSIYMAVFLLIMWCFFIPYIRRTNRDIIGKRKMLLYLPAPICDTPGIMGLINDILQRDTDIGVPRSKAAPDARAQSRADRSGLR